MSDGARTALIFLLMVPIVLGVGMGVAGNGPIEHRLLWALGAVAAATIMGVQIAILAQPPRRAA